jgi:hypothetical protein
MLMSEARPFYGDSHSVLKARPGQVGTCFAMNQVAKAGTAAAAQRQPAALETGQPGPADKEGEEGALLEDMLLDELFPARVSTSQSPVPCLGDLV